MQILTKPNVLALQDLYNRSEVDWVASEYLFSKPYFQYDGEKLVGYCQVLRDDTICNLVVDKDYRCKGIATALLKQAIDEGATYLASLKHNVPFYINRGFKVYCVEYDSYFECNLYYMKIG